MYMFAVLVVAIVAIENIPLNMANTRVLLDAMQWNETTVYSVRCIIGPIKYSL